MTNTFTVSIGSNDYDSYADQETADAYLAPSVTAGAWNEALTSGDDVILKARSLVSATRLIDRMTWDADHDTFAKRAAEAAFVSACCELAARFLDGDTEALEASQPRNVQSVKAGSVSLSYFAASGGTSGSLPSEFLALVGRYRLSTGLAAAMPYAGGTEFQDDTVDSLAVGYGLSRGL